MTPFPDCPDTGHAMQAVDMLIKAQTHIAWIARGGLSLDEKERLWISATGHLQDALAELGFDLRPLKTPAPATAEAYGPHDYAASVGGV